MGGKKGRETGEVKLRFTTENERRGERDGRWIGVKLRFTTEDGGPEMEEKQPQSLSRWRMA